jgi:glutamyl-tRNA(Gln) amidotransferase subunit D
MFPALEDLANIRSRLISNMFSEDMRFSHYNLIAKEIQQEIASGTQGIIITHGTDTLAYTAAALRFIFEHVPIPILLVGSQRSSDRGSTDAALNLLCAAQFTIKSDFADIGICMHTNSNDETCDILPATKTRKMHTSRRDAFKAINTQPYARVDTAGNITYLSKTYHVKDNSQKTIPKIFNEHLKIGILKIHPHMVAHEFENYQHFDGLILEGTGLGHAPINVIDDATKEHKKIADAIKKLAAKIPVVMTPQPLYGRVNMNVYSTGRTLKEIGVLGDSTDMLPETAFIKLAWLLSNYPKDRVKILMQENLRGEITKRSLQHDFLSSSKNFQ